MLLWEYPIVWKPFFFCLYDYVTSESNTNELIKLNYKGILCFVSCMLRSIYISILHYALRCFSNFNGALMGHKLFQAVVAWSRSTFSRFFMLDFLTTFWAPLLSVRNGQNQTTGGSFYTIYGCTRSTSSANKDREWNGSLLLSEP